MRDVLRVLYQTYKYCLARVTILTSEGDLQNGTAFHIGDGWLVTARHILESGSLEEIVTEYCNEKLNVEKIIYSSDKLVDLALIKTDIDLSHYLTKVTIMGNPVGFVKTDHIEIGGHLNDWIGDGFILSKVLLMGYPIVPFSDKVNLVVAEGEVNSVLDKYNERHPYFLISCMPRGGFSGGPVLSEYGFLLGVTTESLVLDNKEAELGYSAVLSVEPLLDLLYENDIFPGKNGEFLKFLYSPIKKESSEQ